MSIVGCVRGKDWKPLFERASVRIYGFEKCCEMVRSDDQCGSWFYGINGRLANCFCIIRGHRCGRKVGPYTEYRFNDQFTSVIQPNHTSITPKSTTPPFSKGMLYSSIINFIS